MLLIQNKKKNRDKNKGNGTPHLLRVLPYSSELVQSYQGDLKFLLLEKSMGTKTHPTLKVVEFK